MARPIRADIDLAALRHNLQWVRQRHPGHELVAVVKANGYGHGLVPTAQALAQADLLGVAAIDEAMLLRQAGLSQPILLMEGCFDASELDLAEQQGFELVIHSHWQLELLEAMPPRQPLRLWIKIDSGMHRLGFAPGQVAGIQPRLRRLAGLRELVWMSHLACADEPEHPANARQLACFARAIAGLPGRCSVRASASILGDAALPMADHFLRPGLMLYGASPCADRSALALGLRPAMTFRSRLIALRELAVGEPVGYGGRFVTRRPSRIGVVAAGYGDGYPRHASQGTPLLIRGQRVPLVGRVSMDMVTVDLTDLPAAAIGDEVILWGEGLPVDEVAAAAGTIAYELFTALAPRVPVEEI